jgi:hypothetical protein
MPSSQFDLTTAEAVRRPWVQVVVVLMNRRGK